MTLSTTLASSSSVRSGLGVGDKPQGLSSEERTISFIQFSADIPLVRTIGMKIGL